MQRSDIRNVAIIAHVDHGKTTLVDSMLKQAGSFQPHEKIAERVMDSMDQERERGITIMAKNTGITLGDVHVNIVDTPGHADFGGEVERTLHMVDGVLLLVDAAEGPLPQTRFVLDKALHLHLRPMLVINKCDRKDARPDEVLQEVYDLFIDLGADEDQLNFPVIYAVARDGWAVRGESMGAPPPEAVAPGVYEATGRDLAPLFDAILDEIPGPEIDATGPLQIQVNAIGYDEYVGRLATGRVVAGGVAKGQDVLRLGPDGIREPGRIVTLQTFSGLRRKDVTGATAGDLITFAGLENVTPGDTIATVDGAEALPRFAVEQPTLTMIFSVNDGPFAGREGKYVTSRQLRERLFRETRGNVALRVEDTESPEKFRVAARGEMALAVLIEQMRREGYEMCLSRPEVVVREEDDGSKVEPIEGVVADVPSESVGSVTEVLGKRGGQMTQMGEASSGRVRVEFRVPTRGLIGFRNMFLTLTRGEGVMSTFFDGWTPWRGPAQARASGAIIAQSPGKTTPYAIFNLQPRGVMFVSEGTEVYEGMIVGEHARDNDIDVHICREKKLTNIRAAGKDEAIILTPPREMRLEQAMEFIDMDELIEVTPEGIRLRKRVLKGNMRPRKKKKDKE